MSADETLPAPVGQESPARPFGGGDDTMAGDPRNPATAPERPRKSGGRDLVRGDALGRYVVLERLGAGGMGVVYAAYDPELDRKLAIKLLHWRGGENLNTAGQARLIAEARAMAKLAHPNVITVFDAVTHAGQVAVVMEFVDGQSLGDWLGSSKGRSTQELLDVFVRAARGLSAAHEAGITHRDFKPDNVMLGSDGRVRVLDFGLAHAEGTELAADTAGLGLKASHGTGSHERLTMTGAIMGTPAYMAPEQYEGVEADGRADQYSFCVSVWEALYGERPFVGATLAELTYAVTKGERKDLPKDVRKVPARVQRALERGLSLGRDERWPDMDALISELQPDPAARRMLIGVASLALLSVVVAGVYLSRPEVPEPCAGVGEESATLWTSEIQRKVAAAFESSGLAYADEADLVVQDGVGSYVKEWSALRRQGCEAAMVRREMSDSLYDQQVVCFDGRLRQARAIISVLSDADAKVVERSSRLVGALPRLAACSEREYLMAAVRPPEDPGLRKEVDAALEKLAELRALEVGGRYEDAVAGLGGLREQGKRINYDPLTAELAIRAGSLLDYQGEYAQAELVLEGGYFAAQRSGAARPAAELAAKLTHVVGDHLERYDEALRWGRHAEAGVDASKLGEAMRARVINNSGNVMFNQGRYEEALKIFERSRALRLSALGPEHPDVAISVANLARTYSKLGRQELAIEMHRQGITIREKTLGRRHPYLSDGYQELALSLDKAGEEDEARSNLERSLEICTASLGDDHPQCAWARVLLAEMLGRHLGRAQDERRRELATQALPVLLKSNGEEHEHVKRTRTLLAELADLEKLIQPGPGLRARE